MFGLVLQHLEGFKCKETWGGGGSGGVVFLDSNTTLKQLMYKEYIYFGISQHNVGRSTY